MNTTPVSLLIRLRRPDEQQLVPPDEHQRQQQVWQQAWRHFVHLYTPLLYGCACRNGLRPVDADDLVSEVLQHLVRKMPEFQYDPKRGRFRDWLAKVLQNKRREMSRRRPPEPVLPESNDRVPAVPDDTVAFDETEYRQYLARRALELMKSEFEESTWTACWDVVVEGRSPAEVATKLNMTRDAVYAARYRVLRRLREELKELLD